MIIDTHMHIFDERYEKFIKKKENIEKLEKEQ